jgi:hypothetical protein
VDGSRQRAWRFRGMLDRPMSVAKKKKEVASDHPIERGAASRGAQILRAYLDDHKDVSHIQLAARIGCARSYIGMLLAGTPPSLAFAARIQRELSIPCIAWTEAAV